jgi:hypothetical protein
VIGGVGKGTGEISQLVICDFEAAASTAAASAGSGTESSALEVARYLSKDALLGAGDARSSAFRFAADIVVSGRSGIDQRSLRALVELQAHLWRLVSDFEHS